LEREVSSTGDQVIPSQVCSFPIFVFEVFVLVVFLWILSPALVWVQLLLRVPPHNVLAAFRRALDHGSSTHLLNSSSEVLFLRFKTYFFFSKI
jgi:hypothetical protein